METVNWPEGHHGGMERQEGKEGLRRRCRAQIATNNEEQSSHKDPGGGQ